MDGKLIERKSLSLSQNILEHKPIEGQYYYGKMMYHDIIVFGKLSYAGFGNRVNRDTRYITLQEIGSDMWTRVHILSLGKTLEECIKRCELNFPLSLTCYN